jgi:hypothetical protein
MSSASQIKSYDSLPDDLEEEASKLVSENVEIEESPSQAQSFTTTEPSVRAVLVYKNGAEGAVRVTGPGTLHPIPNVVTGPNESGWAIITIKRGQTCMFFGNPTVQRFNGLQAQ